MESTLNLYPRWTPNPKPPIGKSDHQFLVKDPDEHKRKNPYDFDALQEKLAANKTSAVSVSKGVLEERERCALIAEGLERGNKHGNRIAQAIRKATPPESKWAKPSNVTTTVAEESNQQNIHEDDSADIGAQAVTA